MFECNQMQILKVGYSWRRLVARQHSRPWLVEVTETDWEGDVVIGDCAAKETGGSVGSASHPPPPTLLYQVRPWRHFQGGQLNLAGLRRILDRIFQELMVRPGQMVTSLCHQFNPHILPAVTLDALEILEEIGCARFVYLRPRPQLGVFSKPSRTACLCLDTDAIKDTVLAVDLTADAPLRYSALLQAVQSHCQPTGGNL